jgi:hypothetical protein
VAVNPERRRQLKECDKLARNRQLLEDDADITVATWITEVEGSAIGSSESLLHRVGLGGDEGRLGAEELRAPLLRRRSPSGLRSTLLTHLDAGICVHDYEYRARRERRPPWETKGMTTSSVTAATTPISHPAATVATRAPATGEPTPPQCARRPLGCLKDLSGLGSGGGVPAVSPSR